MFMKDGDSMFKPGRRKAVSVSPESLVRLESLRAGEPLPLALQPAMDNVNLATWAAQHRELIESRLLKHGALLFRGFAVESAEKFEECARAMCSNLLDYRERSSPRTELSRGIYTSTDYPADQSIHFHNEQSYTKSWPMKLWFYCLQPAERGGATPIADGRKVLSLLSPELAERFRRKKIMYMRNYGDGLGLTWQSAFQTENKLAVEDYCAQSGIDFEWKDGNRLRTRQIFDNIATHPVTGEEVWFEHAAFFHISSLEPAIRESLLAEFADEELPFNTYYGDGSPLEETALAEIREAYEQAAVRFTWQQGDILLLDNMLTSHSRDAFTGERQILVAMGELHDSRSGQTAQGRAQ